MYEIRPYDSVGKFVLYRIVRARFRDRKEFVDVGTKEELEKLVQHLKTPVEYFCERCSHGCHCGYA